MSAIIDKLISILDEQSWTLVVLVLGGFATSISNKIISFFDKKAEKLNDEKTRKLAKEALAQVDDIINTNIVSAKNVMIQQIKEASEDGSIDKEELYKAAEVVKSNVMAQIGVQISNDVKAAIDDLESYVSSRIELNLAVLKGQVVSTENGNIVMIDNKNTNKSVQNSISSENIELTNEIINENQDTVG